MSVDVSIICVSDYKAGEEKSWQDMRAAFQALAHQDFNGTFEVLLMEEAHLVEQIPEDLLSILPQLRVVPSTESSSYTLANAGVMVAEAEYVILLDADCVPEPQ